MVRNAILAFFCEIHSVSLYRRRCFQTQINTAKEVAKNQSEDYPVNSDTHDNIIYKNGTPFLISLGVEELTTFSMSMRISLVSPVSMRCRTFTLWRIEYETSFFLILTDVCPPPPHTQLSHLIGPEKVQTDVGVTCCGIQRVLTVVLTHVLWSGLWEQTIYALPKRDNYGYNSTGQGVNPIKHRPLVTQDFVMRCNEADRAGKMTRAVCVLQAHDADMLEALISIGTFTDCIKFAMEIF